MSAGQFERAFDPLVQGAMAARERGDYRQSLQILIRASECLEEMGAAPEDSRWGEVWILRARVALSERLVNESHRWASKAVEAAEQYGWRDIRARSLAHLGIAKQWMGEAGATDMLLEAFELIRAGADPGPPGGALSALAQALARVGDYEKVRWLLECERDSIDAETDAVLFSFNNYLRARLMCFQRRWDEALRNCQQALADLRGIHHVRGEELCLELLPEVHRHLGDEELAEQGYRDCFRFQERIGSPSAIARVNLGILLTKQSRYGEAESHLLHSAEAFKARGRQSFEMVARAGVMACAAARGWWDRMPEHITPLEDFLCQTDTADADLGDVLELAGDHLDAGEQHALAATVYQLAVEQFERLGDEDRVTALRRKLASVASSSGGFPSVVSPS